MNRGITTIKIIQHNVLKWTFARRNELTNLYLKTDPEIILLNATGIRDNDRIKIFNYNVYQRNRYGEDHAGVAVAIKKNIQHTIIDDLEEDVLAIKVETFKGPAIIATAYHPPRRETFPTEDLLRLMRRRIPVYLLADLNARHWFIGHTRNNEAGTIINNLITRNIAAHVGPDFNTRVNQSGISRPDIVLKNRAAFLNYAIEEGELTTSDHIPIKLTLSTTAIVTGSGTRKAYKLTNWESFKENTERDMNSKCDERDLSGNPRGVNKDVIDKELLDWYNIIKVRLDESTPSRSLQYAPHPRESDLLKALQMAYQQIKNTVVLTPAIRQRTIFLQAEIKTENIRLYNEMWDGLINKIEIDRRDPKKFWDRIRRLFGGRSSGVPLYIWDELGNKITEGDGKLGRFKEVWERVFTISDEENQEFDQVNERRVMRFLEENNHRMRPYQVANRNRLDPNNPLTRPLTLGEMIRIIGTFKNKAPGESGITKNILKQLPRVALQRLNDILNLLVSMGYFSVVFKNGQMVMTPKEGKDSRFVINYRPITLLEVPGKILERTINDRFYEYLETNNILHPNQFGFRRGYGTEVAILKIYETIALNQRYQGQCNIVCRDVAKAFDRVWHDGLKFKIMQQQLPDIIEKILCNYLDNRTAQIKMSGKLSEKFQLKSGVPQGSIIAPTLYVFYTSDLPPAGAGGTDVLFADDISQIIEYPHRSKKALAIRTRREIERVNKFEKEWKIKTNNSKFKILSISKVKPEPVVINNREIAFTNNVNILGFNMGRTGFKTHIKKRMAIAKGTLTKIKRFKKLKPKTKSYLYKTLMRSALEYPNVPSCVMSRSNKNKIQKCQNNIIRKYIHRGVEEELQDENIRDMHIRYKIEPVNVRMHRRAKKTWERFCDIDEAVSGRSLEANDEAEGRDHFWWRRVAPFVMGEDPEEEF